MNIIDPHITYDISGYTDQYSFSLDPFQSQSIYYILKGENILVSAHTSAGKTIVAENAIKIAFSQNKKIIYTAPIKTLSNQKYKEFKEKFKNVGIMTGDIKCDPEANCVIMTTEILRDMLFTDNYEKNFEDIKYVIFDEVHYINDKSRGNVWETCLIKLPKHINLILLSATISNYIDIGNWLYKIRNMPINIILTLKRPIPLNHYLYIPDIDREDKKVHIKEKSIILYDENDKLYIENYNTYIQEYNKIYEICKYSPTYILNKFIKYLDSKNLTPAIFFMFSRNKVLEYAKSVTVSLSDVNIHIESIIDRLLHMHTTPYETLIKIPQVIEIKNLLICGIGVHHAGLLPILKEIVEHLFSEGYLKIIFCTDTFSTGINVPAKSVVFTYLKKYKDGKFDIIGSDEYIQMSGRSGRRGKDNSGYIFHLKMNMNDITLDDINRLFNDKSGIVSSHYYINYNMIFNILDDSKIDDIINNSYRYHNSNYNLNTISNDDQTQSIEHMLSLLNNYDKKTVNVVKTEYTIKKSMMNLKLKKNNVNPVIYGQIYKLLTDIDNLYIKDRDRAQISILQDEKIQIISELINLGYITKTNNMTYELTKYGIFASNIKSCNCILLTYFLLNIDISNMNYYDLGGLISIFSNDKIESEITQDNATLKTLLSVHEQYMNKYKNYNILYEKSICTDMIEITTVWLKDISKKYEDIYYLLNKYNIQEGDFVKNMIKLHNICLEIKKGCEILQLYELSSTITDILNNIYRDIVTTDTLYMRL